MQKVNRKSKVFLLTLILFLSMSIFLRWGNAADITEKSVGPMVLEKPRIAIDSSVEDIFILLEDKDNKPQQKTFTVYKNVGREIFQRFEETVKANKPIFVFYFLEKDEKNEWVIINVLLRTEMVKAIMFQGEKY